MDRENQFLFLNRLANRFDDGKNPLRKAKLKHKAVQIVGLDSVRNEFSEISNVLEKSEPSRGHVPGESFRLPDKPWNDFRAAAHTVRPDSCHPGLIDILCSRDIQLAGRAS